MPSHFLLTRPSDFRRHVRPFFLTPDGLHPMPQKRYYDFFSYLTTQLAFCFTTAPFVILSLKASLIVWARVYFYVVIGVAASMAFFASPAKPWLVKSLNKRNRPCIARTASQETLRQPTLGLPNDPGRDIDEALQEIKQEVEIRRRKGSKVTMPSGPELKAAVEERLGKKL